jgi:hypothetical protein
LQPRKKYLTNSIANELFAAQLSKSFIKNSLTVFIVAEPKVEVTPAPGAEAPTSPEVIREKKPVEGEAGKEKK